MGLFDTGTRWAKWDRKGSKVTGEILTYSQRQGRDFTTGKQEFWDDGSPKMEDVLVIQTTEREDADDDGRRQVVLNNKRKREAVQAALKVAKIKSEADLLGATLVMTMTGEERTEKGLTAKTYTAKITPGAAKPEASSDLPF